MNSSANRQTSFLANATSTLSRTGKVREPPVGPDQHPAPEPAVASSSVSKKLGLAASICGFIGAALGCVSWLVGEHRRWTWAALCVGVAALAWTHVVVAVAIAVGIAILILILGNLA